MSDTMQNLFRNGDKYLGEDNYDHLSHYTEEKYNIIKQSINNYVYYILELLSQHDIIDNSNKPIVYFKEIQNEHIFGDKKILGFMVKNIKSLKKEDKKWNESIFFFFEIVEDDYAELFSIDYFLYNNDNNLIVGREIIFDKDYRIKAFKKGKEPLIPNMVIENIIKGREQNINKLTAIGY